MFRRIRSKRAENQQRALCNSAWVAIAITIGLLGKRAARKLADAANTHEV